MQDSDYSSEEECDESKRIKRKLQFPKGLAEPAPRITPKHKKIVLNISLTKYKVIKDVARSLDWIIQTTHAYNKRDRSDCWDVLWTDQMIEPEVLLRMHFFQKVSHFPGIHVLARKNILGFSFMEMSKKFPKDYNFFPKTWLLPAQYPEFRQEVEARQLEDKNKCYIVKPQASCQGKGIFLTFKTDDVENGKHYVVQEYVQDPFLLDGLKFDFRVYVLLCGTDPMRLYVYEEGLARLATEEYTKPNKNNIKKMCMHLTNYAINKKNSKFVFNKSSTNMSLGHKRSMTSVLNEISKRGFNVQNLKEKIYDVLVKTIIMGQPLVSHQYKFAQPDDEYKNMCFHILGIDVMINEELNPVVIEVNHTPSFATDTPLDYRIKFSLIKDALILLNVNQENKETFVEKTNAYKRVRISKAIKLLQSQEQKAKISLAQSERDAYQNINKGKYHKIYPVDNPQAMQKYQMFMHEAEKVYFSENNVIRSQLEQERQKEKIKLNAKKFTTKNTQIPEMSSSAGGEIKRRNYRSEKNFEETVRKNVSMEFVKKDIRSVSENVQNSPQRTLPSNSPATAPTKTPKLTRQYYGKQSFIDESLPISPQRRRIFDNFAKKIQYQYPLSTKMQTLDKPATRNYQSLRKNRHYETDKGVEIRLSSHKPSKGQKSQRYRVFGTFLTPKIVNFEKQPDDSEVSDMQMGRVDRFGIMSIYRS